MLKEICDTNMGIVTVTGVDVSMDLGIAKVYFSVMGGKKDIQKQKNIVMGMNKMVRKKIAEQVMIRYIPKIRFLFDDTPQKAQNVERILRKIREEI